jgi:hypothetical protein
VCKYIKSYNFILFSLYCYVTNYTFDVLNDFLYFYTEIIIFSLVTFKDKIIGIWLSNFYHFYIIWW